MKSLFVDIHAIQSIPPSNVNRDENGTPKTAKYGEVLRSRVSSASWKRAMKDYFKDNYDPNDSGILTKNLPSLLADKLREKDASLSDDDIDGLIKSLPHDGKQNILGLDLKKNETNALAFISNRQIEKTADILLESKKNSKKVDKKSLQEIFRKDNAIDTALFGRMMANDSSLNVDGAAQIAHALGVDAADIDSDFYSAADDVKRDDETAEDSGAGMIGNFDFISTTDYRYANVNINQLNHNLESAEATVDGIKRFLNAFFFSVPSGKKNGFPMNTYPAAVLITLSHRPDNGIGAFEEPVSKKESEALTETAIKQFVQSTKIGWRAVGEPQKTFALQVNGEDFKELVVNGVFTHNFEELIQNVVDSINDAQGIEW